MLDFGFPFKAESELVGSLLKL